MEKKAILGNIHPTGQLLFTLGIVLFVAMIVVIAGFLLALPFVDQNLTQLMEGLDMNDPSNVGFSKYLQIISHLGMFILPSLIVAWFFGPNISSYLYLDRWPSNRILIISALMIFVSVPFINYILEMNMQMHLPDRLQGLERWMRSAEESAEQMTNRFLNVDTIGGLMLNLFMVALIPAIGEEFMFRGVLMRIFRKWVVNKHLVVWITAIIFSAIHIQFFGFFPRMILGVLFGYLVVYTGSLWPAMVAHFVNNAAAVIFYYLFHQQITDGTFENIGKGSEGLIFASLSFVLTIVIIWWVRRASNVTNPRLE